MAVSRILLATLVLLSTAVSQERLTENTANLCTHAFVLGAVNKRGFFELRKPVKLSQLLQRAGGLSNLASETIQLTTHVVSANCQQVKAVRTQTLTTTEIEGVEVRAGQGVVVKLTDIVFVVGVDTEDQSIRFRSGMTLTEVLQVPGAIKRRTPRIRIKLVRFPEAGGRPTTTNFLLRALERRELVDPRLRPSDIIEISDENGSFGHAKPVKLGAPFNKLPVNVGQSNR